MSLLKKRILISAASAVILVFLCYGAYPRNAQPISGLYALKPTLVIDAGHGGEDGGAVSASGLKESQLNLSIALRAENLSALLGLKPSMVRRNDVSIHDVDCNTISQKKNSDLRNRVKFVNETEDAILLSIHQNHFSESKYRGAQVFYADTAGSEALARAMQDDLKSFIDPRNHRQHKLCQNVYLMKNIRCPAVLLECGFLSNAKETHLLQDENYQKKLTIAMLRSIVQMGNGVLTESEI